MTDDILEPADPARWVASGDQRRVKVKSNLRQAASLNAPVCAIVNADTIVNVIGEDGNWWHVEIHGSIAKSQVGPTIVPKK